MYGHQITKIELNTHLTSTHQKTAYIAIMFMFVYVHQLMYMYMHYAIGHKIDRPTCRYTICTCTCMYICIIDMHVHDIVSESLHPGSEVYCHQR